MKVEFYKHSLQDRDIQNVVDVLHSIFLTTGPVASDFEDKFSKLTGLRHTVALNSCTAALHLALLALGIGPGDEVITTPMTFIATATAIIHTGAKAVFVDVDPDTGLIDPNLVESAITSETKAVMPVHLYGTMADMKALRDIANQHGLFIIEDSAHCIEGERDGVRPGYFSDAACYSFYATKNLTCGEGGALATNNEELAKKVRLLRQHGMSKEAADRYHGMYRHWDMVELGWKYNLDDIHAALLINQIDRLGSCHEERMAIFKHYDESFRSVPGIEIPRRPGRSAVHLYSIWVDPKRRDEYLLSIQKRGVGVAVNYRAIHTLYYFREVWGLDPDNYPVARRIGDRTISLPLYPRLTESELKYVVETVREVVTGGS